MRREQGKRNEICKRRHARPRKRVYYVQTCDRYTRTRTNADVVAANFPSTLEKSAFLVESISFGSRDRTSVKPWANGCARASGVQVYNPKRNNIIIHMLRRR